MSDLSTLLCMSNDGFRLDFVLLLVTSDVFNVVDVTFHEVVQWYYVGMKEGCLKMHLDHVGSYMYSVS